MDMGADTADTSHNVHILYIVAVLADAFDAPVDVSEAQNAVHDLLALNGQQE